MSKFIIWAGSKTKLLPKILSFAEELIKDKKRVVEPFLGSGTVMLELLRKYPDKEYLANDKNALVINAFQMLQKYPDELAEELAPTVHALETFLDTDEYTEEFRKNTYLAERERLNRYISTNSMGLPMAVSFLIVNHLCYNGLFRVNAKGHCNTPYGSYHPLPTHEELKELSSILQPVTFSCSDYKDVLKKPSKAFIYADPPYRPLTTTANFTSYTKDGFTEADHEELARLITKAVKKGNSALVHGSWTEDIKLWTEANYPQFELHEVKAERRINCKKDKRGNISEAIIVSR